ncbi:MAG: dihydrofolate reductase family protein [Gemmatimonadales bacterium]
MRKLVVGTFLTLDGVMQAPGGPDEDPSGGFKHGGWAAPYFDDMMMGAMTEWIERAGGLLLGRHTYEIFAAHWPYVTGDDPIAAKLNQLPKYVASRSLDRAGWRNSTLLEGDLEQEVRTLKAQPGGELQVHGSGNLIQTLLRHQLVDEFRLWFLPLVLGIGKRLFAEGTIPASLELVETRTSTTCVTFQVYRPIGKPAYGSFELPEPSAAELERRRKIGAPA